MGNLIFGLDIAKIAASAIASAGGLLPATFAKASPGARTPGALTSGTNPTYTSYPCQGLVDTFDNDEIDGTIIKRSDRKILLLGATMNLPSGVEPAAGDQVTIEGRTYAVEQLLDRDPAAATYTLHARG